LSTSRQYFIFGLSTILKSISNIKRVDEIPHIDKIKTTAHEYQYNLLLLGASHDIKGDIQKFVKANLTNDSIDIILLFDSQQEIINQTINIKEYSNILKNSDVDEIRTTISAILEGHKFCPKNVSNYIQANNTVSTNLIKSKSGKLIMESIMYLMYHEKTSKEISSILHLSPRTVEDYRAKILRATNSYGRSN
jgi:DNA-binding NarL/FixJ family response regulator